MHRQRTTNRKYGFTLIELLVVIAIIAILAAILFPVFAQARSKARQATGISNAKQVSLAILMYSQDFDEMWARAGYECLRHDQNGPIVENPCGATSWPNTTGPYHKNAGVFKSPADSATGSAGQAADGNVSLLINDLLAHVVPSDANGYADMANQHQAAVGLSQASVNAPADCVLLAEGHCGWDKVNSADGQNSPEANAPSFDGNTDIHSKFHRENTISGYQTYQLAGSPYANDWGQRTTGVPFYTGGGVVAFCDGHVKYIRMVDSAGKPTLCSTLKWTQHMDPQQRHMDQDGCSDPLNPKGANGNWQ